MMKIREKKKKKKILMSQFYTIFEQKIIKSETTSFHDFSPRILNIKKVWKFDFEKWGQKDR